MKLPVLPLALLALLSCSETLEQPTDAPEAMNFTASDATRALVDATAIGQKGTILRLFDYYTARGVAGFTSNHTNYFGPEGALYEGDGHDTWTRYISQGVYAGPYYWTREGTHRFFGWARTVGGVVATQMIPDYEMHLSYDEPHLHINSLTLTDRTTPQFDFVYTDVVTRSMEEPDPHAVVPLRFHHLFAALNLSVENVSTQPVIITGLRVNGLKTTGTANILFTQGTPEVRIPASDQETLTEQTGGFLQAAYNTTVAAGQTTALFADNQQCRLLWPQTLQPLDFTLKYKYTADGAEQTRTVRLTPPAGLTALAAGQKYRVTIRFEGDKAALTAQLSVLPWETEQQTMDIKIEVDPGLQFVDATPTNHEVELPVTPGYLAFTFTPKAPQQGQWTVGFLENDNLFTLHTTPDDTGETYTQTGRITGQSVTLYVRPRLPNITADRAECHLTLHIQDGDIQGDATDLFDPEPTAIVYHKQ